MGVAPAECVADPAATGFRPTVAKSGCRFIGFVQFPDLIVGADHLFFGGPHLFLIGAGALLEIVRGQRHRLRRVVMFGWARAIGRTA